MGLTIKLSVITLALCAAVLAALTLLSFEQAKSILDLTAPDGDANQFNNQTHAAAKILLGIYAAACAALAIAIVVFRERLTEQNPLHALTRTRIAWHDFTRHTTRLEWLILSCITIIGVWLRWASLELPMHSDESWTYLNYVSRNPLHIISQYESPNNHVLHSLFAWTTTTLLGDTNFALRIPAFLAGISCLPLVYWLTLRQSNRQVAMLAMTLIAVWPMLVDYSANARGYSMITAGTLALIISADAIRRDGQAAAYGAFAVIAAFGLYTIPSFSISIITAGLWLVFVIALQRDPNSFLQTTTRLSATAGCAIALTLVLYAPIIAINGVAAILSNDVVTGDESGVAPLVHRIVDVWRDWQQGIPIWLQVGVMAGFIAAFFAKHHQLRTMWAALLCAATLIAVAQGTVGPSRIWMFALPLCLVYASMGSLMWWSEKTQRHAALVLSVGILTVFSIAYLREPDHALYTEFGEFSQAKALTEHIDQELEPNDGLATMFPANRTINWYARKLGAIKKIGNARQNFRSHSFERLIIIAPSGTTSSDTLEWNDQLNASEYASREYNIIKTIEVDGATLRIVEFI